MSTARIWATLVLLVVSAAAAMAHAATASDGRAIYDFYCYQCHGYSGDAQTVAATVMDPPPRNFTTAAATVLDRARMVSAATNGRPGTAMTAFGTVLSTAEIDAVVDYIRASFMSQAPERRMFHTAANGWPDHDRYQVAFDFAVGRRSAADVVAADESDRRAWRLYLSACSTCHDRGSDTPVAWSLRPVSFPRNRYDHRRPDLIVGASPYALHDENPTSTSMRVDVERGEVLFRENCAFCHGGDGSGRNWIGSFLVPNARDLRRYMAAQPEPRQLRAVIERGLPNTSMPAWRFVLSPESIDDIVSYLRHAMAPNSSLQRAQERQHVVLEGCVGECPDAAKSDS